ncbi:MAG TPA: GTP cyclohydrolase I [Candidatus Polarisedimenticolia bacterium]|nr:GTP cyclohydrolase I [Candidatus Polarisedimenticolia bacterium]
MKSKKSALAPRFNRKLMERGIRIFLQGIGPVVPPSVLRETPRQVAEAWAGELLAGYRKDGKQLLVPLAEDPPDSLIVVRGIRFVSICRHHLLPFQGTAAVGYLPGPHLAGFSSLARLVDSVARRLQIQEDLSEEILDHLEAVLSPRGAACLLEASHQCMTCRGAAQPGSLVTTLRYRGVFAKKADMRRDLVALLAGPPNYSERE